MIQFAGSVKVTKLCSAGEQKNVKRQANRGINFSKQQHKTIASKKLENYFAKGDVLTILCKRKQNRL
jgi:hypothetical protein